MTTFLLVCVYLPLGAAIVIAAACALGMVAAVITAVLSILTCSRRWWLVLLYAAAAVILAGCAWGFFILASWIGARTQFIAWKALYVGVVLAGLPAVRIVPEYVAAARRQMQDGIECYPSAP